MYKYCVLLILLLLGTKSGAQVQQYQRHQLKLSPLRLTHLGNPGVELSYEVRYGDFSTQLSSGYLVDIFQTTGCSNLHGYRFNLQEKYFVKKFSRAQFYLGIEVGINKLKMIKNTSYTSYYTDEYYEIPYTLKRRSYIVDSNFGWMIPIKNFVIDVGLGLGVKFQKVEHVNKMYSEFEEDDVILDIGEWLYEGEGEYLMLNIPLTVKIGYSF